MGYSIGDIIQITDEQHSWFPCLLIVSEVRAWGVTAYVLIPQSNDGSIAPSQAFNRLEYGVFEKVGTAAFARELIMKAKLIKDIVGMPGYWLVAGTVGDVVKIIDDEWDYEFTPCGEKESWYVSTDEFEVIGEGDANEPSEG